MQTDGTSLESACAKCKDNCCSWGPLVLLPGEWDRIRALRTDDGQDLAVRIDRASRMIESRDDGLTILQKKPGEPCPFLSQAARCLIYEDRPRDCRIWPIYYSDPHVSPGFSIAPRCPATGADRLPTRFTRSATIEVLKTSEELHGALHHKTVSGGYELRPLLVSDLRTGSFLHAAFPHFRREMLLILLSVLFGFALVEITKTLLSLVPWLIIGVQRAAMLLALVIIIYFVLNCIRYVWAHVTLSAFVPLALEGHRWARLAAFVHDLMFPLQAMFFVAMALILTIPGVPVFSSLPPPELRADLLVRYIDTLVAGFLLLNLLLALADLAWCHLMSGLLFRHDDHVCLPPELDAWRKSSADEVTLFSISAIVLLVATNWSLKDLVPYGGLWMLFSVVVLPWVTMAREFSTILRSPAVTPPTAHGV